MPRFPWLRYRLISAQTWVRRTHSYLFQDFFPHIMHSLSTLTITADYITLTNISQVLTLKQPFEDRRMVLNMWFVYHCRFGQCLCFGVDHSALDNSCQPGCLLHAQSPVRTILMELDLMSVFPFMWKLYRQNHWLASLSLSQWRCLFWQLIVNK